MMSREITLNSKIVHTPSGDIITVTKINQKTFCGSSTLHPYARYVRVKKEDCAIQNPIS
jgi:hypothetical protein